jgi:tetratricopeptide (TPR) repeat protein
MDNKMSLVDEKVLGAEKREQVPATSKGEATHRRTNIKMMQNVLLIWLDTNIDDSNEDCRKTIIQLQRTVNTIKTFTNGEECLEFIKDMSNEKVCMIVSGSLGQHIVPGVHNMSQVDSIFIFCGNKKRHEPWAKEWAKVRGVFTEISPICEALKQVSRRCEQAAIPISFVATDTDTSTKSLDQLDPTFMYTQILKEILLTIKFNQKHIKEFMEYCRDAFTDNKNELKNVDRLEQQYQNKTPIWWYTSDCFLYSMLNRAVRMTDVNILIKMGFFIKDLHDHIEELHYQQFGDDQNSKLFTIYRGQGLAKTDFDQLMNTKGGLMSFNNFLPTSKDRNISLSFARNALANADSVGILFVLKIDPSQSTEPFAAITDVSYFQAEDEVLFSMHTVFRIRDIKPLDENHRLFQVDLTLTSDNDKDLCTLTDRIREETKGSSGLYRLGLLLRKMGNYDKAEELYNVLLDQTTDESEKGSIYHLIAWTKNDQGEYEESLTFYEKALVIYQKTLPPTHLNFANIYTNIGMVYDSMGNHLKALSYYEKALEIRQQSLPPSHPNLAASYSNIGFVYANMGDYSKGQSFYEHAVDIAQRSLPATHPDLIDYKKQLDEIKSKL